jgi:hypothetical protein
LFTATDFLQGWICSFLIRNLLRRLKYEKVTLLVVLGLTDVPELFALVLDASELLLQLRHEFEKVPTEIEGISNPSLLFKHLSLIRLSLINMSLVRLLHAFDLSLELSLELVSYLQEGKCNRSKVVINSCLLRVFIINYTL